MSERKIFISKRCSHSTRLLVGLSQHDLLKYFDIINIDVQNQIPPFVKSVPTLFHNGQIVAGQPLFDYMNEFAKKIMTANEKKESKEDDEFEGWCPDGGCSIGFSEISEKDDNFKDSFHKDITGSFEQLAPQGAPLGGPSELNTENSSSDKRTDEFNQKYEQLMSNRNNLLK
tara:strand:+ start:13651 stop:14166 length:516 start_codon:yes stop_codon:yes gene_type:complete